LSRGWLRQYTSRGRRRGNHPRHGLCRFSRPGDGAQRSTRGSTACAVGRPPGTLS
jgi:hypothetical protein